MSTLVTEAIVLHAFDYLETSRIIRLMTREAGVQSVLARGARNSRKRFGNAGDLFSRLDTVKVVRCDEVQWRFLGLSLAGYNVLISLLMAAIAAWGFVRTAQR